MKSTLTPEFLDKVYFELRELTPSLTKVQFITYLNKSEVFPFKGGIFVVEDDNVHIHILKGYRGRTYLRKALEKTFGYLFKKYQTVKTFVRRGNEKAETFVDTLGFKKEYENSEYTYFKLNQKDYKYGFRV